MWITLGIIAFIAVLTILLYNKLVALRQKRKQAFSDIDVQLKQRFNLIPKLLETVKGYAAHEKEVLQNVTDARVGVEKADKTVGKRSAAEIKLTGAMVSLYAVAENYPDLKANETFQKLMDELSETEDKIAAARRFFNSATQQLNTAVEQFPANLIASKFGFKKEEFFEVDETTNEAMQKPPEIAI